MGEVKGSAGREIYPKTRRIHENLQGEAQRPETHLLTLLHLIMMDFCQILNITASLTLAQSWAALDEKSGSGLIDFDFLFHLVNFTHKLKDSDPKIQSENFNLARKWLS